MFYYSAFILDFITLVLQIFLCWSIASNLQAKFLPTKSWPEQITYNYFLFFAYIILSLTVLGALGLLTLKYSIVLNLTAFALALKYCPKPPKLTFKADYKRLIFYLPLVLLLSILFVIASQQAVIEADSLTYHMPYIIKWLQEGSLWHPYYTAYVGVIGYYPGNYELLSLFTILPFNQDLFVNLINFSLYLPLGLCLYIIFRQLKVPEKTAQVLPALLLYTPLLVRQGPIPQNDLFYLLVLAFAFLFFIKKHWLAFAIALGLFLGTKANAIVYSALVFLPACYYIKDYKKILKVSALIILFGGFWYIRNWILTGNPLFPMHLETGGLTIFQGYQSAQESLKASAVFPQHITDLNLYKSLAINFFHSTGLIILSTVTAIIFTFFKHRRFVSISFCRILFFR